MKKLILIFALCLAASPVLAASRNILLIGFWPPTNEMLREFSPLSNHNLGQWQGRNWRSLGYDVYAYFPEFKNPKFGRAGEGSFRVDFAATYNDFMKATLHLKPIAILGFGNGLGPWELEINYPNYFYNWFISNTLPSSLGIKIRYPIAESLKQNIDRKSSLPNFQIVGRVNEAQISGLNAYVNENGSPGDYLCGFLSYLIAWYHDEHARDDDPAHNEAGGFVHVSDVDPHSARLALDISLQTTIESLRH